LKKAIFNFPYLQYKLDYYTASLHRTESMKSQQLKELYEKLKSNQNVAWKSGTIPPNVAGQSQRWGKKLFLFALLFLPSLPFLFLRGVFLLFFFFFFFRSLFALVLCFLLHFFFLFVCIFPFFLFG